MRLNSVQEAVCIVAIGRQKVANQSFCKRNGKEFADKLLKYRKGV